MQLNAQLPPDLAQQQVNPTTLPGFSLPTGQNGLFHVNPPDSQAQGVTVAGGKPAPHYLIETNPALTNLKQFMSSSYMLNLLGYSPDQSYTLLGDGLYEERLIDQAIEARTGQRFIDGLTSDDATFKYLMDNAIASKDALNLQLGVSLTADQVAALTHDIVWMEDQVVDGQHVLVPVLYLAQANNRLAPNGALIQGQDVTLISGNNLTNAGTLRASNNLAAYSGNNLLNTGLIEAGNRTDLLATNSLVNSNGGIIKGKDVTLTATNGDVTNLTSTTTHNSARGPATWTRTFVDSAASVEAGNTLTINAGHDVNNSGVLKSGGDLSIAAGNDVNVASVENVSGQTTGTKHTNKQITQVAADVSAGGNLTITADHDISVTASNVTATGNLTLGAGNDITVSSAADETHSYFKNKTHEIQNDHTAQVASTLTAGGDLNVKATHDLTLTASKASAGGEAYLYAGNDLSLKAAENKDYSLYDMKKSGSFGSKKTQHDEVTQNTWVGSEVKSGGNLSLVSGKDQVYQVAKLDSGKDLTIQSGGGITFTGEKDLHQETHEKSNSNLAWMSASGKGKTDETLRQTEMVAKGQLVINAVNQIHIDVKQVNKQTVSQTIDAMVKADPELSWIKDEEAKGNIDWKQVKEIHDSFKYSHSGLGAGSEMILAIMMAVIVGPEALGALSTATASTVISAGGAAIATGAATTAVSSVISEKGNLGAALKDTFSSDSLKGYAVSGLTAGFTAGVLNDAFGVTGDDLTKASHGFNLADPVGVGKFLSYTAAESAFQATAKTAIVGGSFADNLGDGLTSAAITTLQAVTFNAVGDYSHDQNWADGSIQKVALHGLVGGLLSQAEGGTFATGALAAGANEAMLPYLSSVAHGNQGLLSAYSQVVGVVVAGVTNGDIQKTSEITSNATNFNYLNHHQVDNLVGALEGCRTNADPAACRANVQSEYNVTTNKTSGSYLTSCVGASACDTQDLTVREGNLEFDYYLGDDNPAGLRPEEKAIVQAFDESTFQDGTIAYGAMLQNSGIAGGVLAGAGAALGAAETAVGRASAGTATVEGALGEGAGGALELERGLGGTLGHDEAASIIEGGSGQAFAGHGVMNGNNLEPFTIIPEGTTLIVPRPDINIADSTGAILEQISSVEELEQVIGSRVAPDGTVLSTRNLEDLEGYRVLGAGDETFNYTLLHPGFQGDKLTIFSNSTTTLAPVNLSELFESGMGCVVWAACTRGVFSLPKDIK